MTTPGGTSGGQTFTINAPPAFTSAAAASFTVGAPGTFPVTATGVPPPAISVVGALPTGVTFVDNGNGTGTLAGTPASGTAGTYPLTFTATNSSGSATQSFTLTVSGVAPPNPSIFNFTGGPASFTVPAGVTSIRIVAIAPNGGADAGGAVIGGRGGRAEATISVVPGTMLTVRVGGQGATGVDGSSGAGGFNGGGSAGLGGGGGGGASSVFDGTTALVIAGGAGAPAGPWG